MSVSTLQKPLNESITPLQDRIVVECAPKEEKSEGGILIPTSGQEKPVRGTVAAVGPGKRLDSGETQLMSLKVGDKILFGKYAGTEVKFGNKEYIVMREDDAMAKISE